MLITRQFFWLSLFLISAILLIPKADAFLGIPVSSTSKVIRLLGKVDGALPQSQIDEFAQIALRPQGSREVGQILGKMNLPESVREDTYLRILAAQNKIKPAEADELLVNLKGTPGFVSVMKGSLSGQMDSSLGHIHELRLATAAKKSGFNVLNVSEDVVDEARRGGMSEIDIVLSYKNKTIAIESKGRYVTLDQYRPQLDAIQKYTDAQGKKAVPIAAFREAPDDLVMKEIERRGVYLVIGDAESQATQMKVILDALD